ncbi:hypothetical protein [Microlunatus sp. GCM10028923]|uniref:hypothetical protein n=1 Tax=Microlunatus sp. GCM10028923 TaxID=3273400 RepID=UPI0036102711
MKKALIVTAALSLAGAVLNIVASNVFTATTPSHITSARAVIDFNDDLYLGTVTQTIEDVAFHINLGVG